MADNVEPEILTETRGHLGLITLNRPKAVNSLTIDMIDALDEALTEFEQNSEVTVVALTGAGDRGLCAGGDVVALHRFCTEDPALAQDFFRREYQLDYRISAYSKPVVALMNGLVLGGGVGISGPASHRVVTDSTRLGMPETGIGFSPDVAGAYYLAQAPGRVGEYLATTGVHINAADSLFINIADFYVEDASLQDLLTGLEKVTEAEQVSDVIAGFTTELPEESQLAQDAEWIDRVFDAESIEQVVSNLQALAESHPDHAAGRALRKITSNSPTGVKVALEAVRKAENLSIAETLHMDFRTTMNAAYGHDLVEGIRAQLIDKDRNPKWQPATFEEVSDERVASFFEPLSEVSDLELDLS